MRKEEAQKLATGPENITLYGKPFLLGMITQPNNEYMRKTGFNYAT